MKKAALSLLLFVVALSARAETPPLELDDLMSPNEIADEFGLPRTEALQDMQIMTFDDISELEGVDLFREYPMVLIINKKDYGPGAQQMKVYENGVLTYQFKVSTGRERWETARSGRTYFTATPVGYYTPYTLIRNAWSETWKAPMDFAVFFIGGVAVHATTPNHYKELGRRASGGCVRLHRDNAQYVFEKVKALGKGLVPVVKRNGAISRNRNGIVVRAVKWRTLIIVQNQ